MGRRSGFPDTGCQGDRVEGFIAGGSTLVLEMSDQLAQELSFDKWSQAQVQTELTCAEDRIKLYESKREWWEDCIAEQKRWAIELRRRLAQFDKQAKSDVKDE